MEYTLELVTIVTVTVTKKMRYVSLEFSRKKQRFNYISNCCPLSQMRSHSQAWPPIDSLVGDAMLQLIPDGDVALHYTVLLAQ